MNWHWYKGITSTDLSEEKRIPFVVIEQFNTKSKKSRSFSLFIRINQEPTIYTIHPVRGVQTPLITKKECPNKQYENPSAPPLGFGRPRTSAWHAPRANSMKPQSKEQESWSLHPRKKKEPSNTQFPRAERGLRPNLRRSGGSGARRRAQRWSYATRAPACSYLAGCRFADEKSWRWRGAGVWALLGRGEGQKGKN
jgi:hypothetical protein